MKLLLEHPELVAQTARYDELRRAEGWLSIEINQLAVGLKYLTELDPNAVYHIVGDSTVVYYANRLSAEQPGTTCRIVLAPNGKHRRIGRVGFDPR